MRPNPLILAVAFAFASTLAQAGGHTPLRAPPTLAATGLYADPATLAIDPRNLPFSPQYPLWSDGAAKSRWVYLPPSAKIDVSDPDHWQLPVGTKLWKQFELGGRKVETRFIARVAKDDWIFATYLWNDAQTEATLAPAEGIASTIALAPNKRHQLPGVVDCESCHRAGPDVVLGFNALQLSDDRDPLAPHGEALPPDALTLASLAAADRFSPARPEWLSDPPRIAARTPRERAVFGYLAGNCGGCHNREGSLAHLGLSLAHPSAPTLTGPGRFVVPGIAPEHSRIIAPGAPDHSALLYRMASRSPIAQMPPLGTVLVDVEATTLIRDWIADLPAPEALPRDWKSP